MGWPNCPDVLWGQLVDGICHDASEDRKLCSACGTTVTKGTLGRICWATGHCCIIAFSFSFTQIVLYKLQSKPTSSNKLSSLFECRFYNTAYDNNSLIVESGQSSEALDQHGLPKQREWSGGGHCQCFLLLPCVEV